MEEILVLKEEAVKKKLPALSFQSVRRFGVEFEYNAFDKRSRPEQGKRVAGIFVVAKEVEKHCEQGVEIRDYEHTSKNERWVVKPDSSCGMEVVTPPLKGWRGLLQTCRVVEGISQHPQIEADHRCSVHVHVEVADLSEEQLSSLICHWIKCEPIFLDMMPTERKRNRYCQHIGLSNRLTPGTRHSMKSWVEEIGDVKYYSMNTHQMRRSNYERKTVEFRVCEAGGCKDPYLVKNWVRLLLHFVEMCKKRPIPENYEKGRPPLTNGIVWLDLEDVLTVLGFSNNPPQYELSHGLTQIRNWMLARLAKNLTTSMPGMPRYIAYRQLHEILDRFKQSGEDIDLQDALHPRNLAEALYSENFKY
jgi:hypothetical protein